MQEERRLGPYSAVQGWSYKRKDVHLAEQILQEAYLPGVYTFAGNWSCGDLHDYDKNLENEANKTHSEVAGVPLPAGSSEEYFGSYGSDAVMLPTNDIPDADDLAPDGAAMRAIIYHVNVDTSRPQFSRLYMSMPMDPNFDWVDQSAKKQFLDANRPCADFGGPPPDSEQAKQPNTSPQNSTGRYSVVAAYPACYRYIAFGLPDGSYQTYYPLAMHRNVYDNMAGTLDITETTLSTRVPLKLPEYIEIDGDSGLTVTTDLAPTKHHWRWVAPPIGKKFDIYVTLPRTPGSSH